MTSQSESDLPLEVGHVLFIDIFGYSKLLIDEQKEGLSKLPDVGWAPRQVFGSIKIDRRLDALRGDPRFDALVRKIMSGSVAAMPWILHKRIVGSAFPSSRS